jgi:hypothetical protein
MVESTPVVQVLYKEEGGAVVSVGGFDWSLCPYRVSLHYQRGHFAG